MIKSLKVRLTLLYVGIFAAFLLALAAFVHFSTEAREFTEFDQDLEGDAKVFAKLVAEELYEIDTGEHTWENWTEELEGFPGHLQGSAAVYYRDGRVVFSTKDLAGVLPRTDVPRDRVEFRTVHWVVGGRRGEYRVVYVPVVLPDSSRHHLPVTVEYLSSLDTITEPLRQQLARLTLAVPTLILLAGVAGYLFVRKLMHPVDEMAALAKEISAGDLARRIPIPSSEGELRTLARTLNGMLARLEHSFTRLKTFTADAAHELRTPIATVRAALETSLGGPHAELAQNVGEALEELGRLSEIVEKLLLLARADAGRLVLERVDLDLADVAARVVGALQPVAALRGVSIELDARAAHARGDAGLLLRAVHNVVENAIKYTRENGRVRVTAGPDGIRVSDDGEGIRPEQLPHVFERFYRADTSRSDKVPGTGLGLALARSIVEAHGGGITVESRPAWTEFWLRVQARAEAADAGARPSPAGQPSAR